MPKVSMSFQKIRKNLLKRIASKSGDQKMRKVLRFPNEDVPTFLRDLDEFEEKSKRTKAMVR